MAGVFISYRRADSAGWSGRLFDHLSNRFGSDLVFQDFDDIPPGGDFVEVIRSALQECEACLVMIGPYWLVNQQGQRRLDNPEDVLRMEIALAMENQLVVIPTLVGGAMMPGADDLPEPLKKLSRLNAVEISDRRWNYDVSVLLDYLSKLITPGRGKYSLSEAQQEANNLQTRYFEQYSHDASAALEVAQEGLSYLDRVTPLYPQDSYLQVLRGYFHKNKAMALRDLGRAQECQAALDVADQVFSTMIQENDEDAAAWNGKGSVETLRGNFSQALAYIDRALEIAPNYQAAQSDREKILGSIKP